MKVRKKLGLLMAGLLLCSSITVCAQTAYFSSFSFKTSAYQDKTAEVTSATKSSNEANWYYTITSLAGVDTPSSGKFFYLEPNYSGGGLGCAIPAIISSSTTRNVSLQSSYYDACPQNVTYTLYARSNDAYGDSMYAIFSGYFMP